MKYVILVLYLFSYTVGFANIAFLIIAHKSSKQHEGLILQLIMIFSAFTLYNLVLNVGFFLSSIVGYVHYEENFFYFSFYSIVNSLLIYAGVYFGHFICNVVFDGLRRLFFISISLLPLIFLGIRFFSLLVFGDNPRDFSKIILIDYYLTLIVDIYFICLFWQTWKKIRDAFYGWAMKYVVILSSIIIPIGIYQVFFNFHQHNSLRPLNIENLFYFLTNIISAIFVARTYLLRPQTSLAPFPDSILSDVEFAEQKKMLAHLGITSRENDIIKLVRAGLSNTDIAVQLKIEPVTVKNHLHNIYQKTMVRNRMELINLFQKELV